MKKSKFTESQIVGILKQADAGMPSRTFAAKPVSAYPPTISGSQSMAAWRRRI